jgi:hypothetical protein
VLVDLVDRAEALIGLHAAVEAPVLVRCGSDQRQEAHTDPGLANSLRHSDGMLVAFYSK